MSNPRRETLPIPEDLLTPFVRQPFYQWLLDNEGTMETRKTTARDAYLKTLGFDEERHRLTPDDFQLLCMIHETYNDRWMPCREPQHLSDLFRLNYVDPLPGDQGNAYWIRLSMTRHRYGRLRDVLRNLINEHTLVYPLDPKHFCFEVINGVLFIKYQHIIGGRRLCPVIVED